VLSARSEQLGLFWALICSTKASVKARDVPFK